MNSDLVELRDVTATMLGLAGCDLPDYMDRAGRSDHLALYLLAPDLRHLARRTSRFGTPDSTTRGRYEASGPRSSVIRARVCGGVRASPISTTNTNEQQRLGLARGSWVTSRQVV